MVVGLFYFTLKISLSESVNLWVVKEICYTPVTPELFNPVPMPKNKKTSQFYKILNCKGLEYLGPESNRHWHLYANWILSPTRLPIPPPRQKLIRQVVVSNLRS